MHHLARHSVACFLTRGDLYQSWEKGRDVFERLLIDHDWSLNSANWQWLSASTFFSQYFRVYSPVAFGQKYDKSGQFIRRRGSDPDPGPGPGPGPGPDRDPDRDPAPAKLPRRFLPVLKDMPDKYIYEPWKAPEAVQKRANCIVGVDYPRPIVDHKEVSDTNKGRMARSYQANKENGLGGYVSGNVPVGLIGSERAEAFVSDYPGRPGAGAAGKRPGGGGGEAPARKRAKGED